MKTRLEQRVLRKLQQQQQQQHQGEDWEETPRALIVDSDSNINSIFDLDKDYFLVKKGLIGKVSYRTHWLVRSEDCV